MKFEKSSGNVFADLGFPDAEAMQVKSGLVIKLSQLIEAQGLSQTEAAKAVGLSQPKLSNIMRGNFRGVSEHKLMECLTRLGTDVEIVLRTRTRSRRMGHLKVVFT
jgi:predicted XRE-type DNA-binding protein